MRMEEVQDPIAEHCLGGVPVGHKGGGGTHALHGMLT